MELSFNSSSTDFPKIKPFKDITGINIFFPILVTGLISACLTNSYTFAGEHFKIFEASFTVYNDNSIYKVPPHFYNI